MFSQPLTPASVNLIRHDFWLSCCTAAGCSSFWRHFKHVQVESVPAFTILQGQNFPRVLRGLTQESLSFATGYSYKVRGEIAWLGLKHGTSHSFQRLDQQPKVVTVQWLYSCGETPQSLEPRQNLWKVNFDLLYCPSSRISSLVFQYRSLQTRQASWRRKHLSRDFGRLDLRLWVLLHSQD